MRVEQFKRTEHQDPRERLLMLYGVWVKCLPHQAGRRRLVEQAIQRCKAEIVMACPGCGHRTNKPCGAEDCPIGVDL